MTEFDRINRPRVDKIVHAIEVVLKSARANGVSEEDLGGLFAPVLAALPGPSLPADDSSLRRSGMQHPDLLIHMAKTVPLDRAIAVLQVVATRVDDELFARKGGDP